MQSWFFVLYQNEMTLEFGAEVVQHSLKNLDPAMLKDLTNADLHELLYKGCRGTPETNLYTVRYWPKMAYSSLWIFLATPTCFRFYRYTMCNNIIVYCWQKWFMHYKDQYWWHIDTVFFMLGPNSSLLSQKRISQLWVGGLEDFLDYGFYPRHLGQYKSV